MKTAVLSQASLSLIMLTGMMLTIGLALGFEHVGGFVPCELCLQQRIPYYVAIPLVGTALTVPTSALGRWGSRLLLLVAAITMTVGAVLALYHAGVEWQWWSGPSSCTATGLPRLEGDILMQLRMIEPACNRVAWRIIGLSFAGWNVVSSTVFALIGYYAVFKRQGEYSQRSKAIA
jgi:disulfide bond formation protein DsbB